MSNTFKKKYKKSIYNMELKQSENNDVLIFNTLTTSLVAMDEICKNLYNNIDNIDVSILADVELENINGMIENGFIVLHDIDEFELYKTKSSKNKFVSDVLNITIGTTLDCNMACPYCYEKAEEKYLDENMSDIILDFIDTYMKSKKIDKLHISWYGGEPLLNMHIIEYMSHKLIEKVKSENIKYSANIITNGTLLTKDIAMKLKNLSVESAQVTLDGMKESNDKRRLLKSGESSYDIITEKVLECNSIIPITVRCNIDRENSVECAELQNFFMKNKIDFYFARVDSLTESNENYKHCLSHKEFSDLEIGLFDKSINNCKCDAIDLIPSQRFLYCGALREDNFVIDPNGNLYKCWSEIGDTKKTIGNVASGILYNKQNIKWLNLDLDEKCKKCNKLPICAGGCPLAKFNNINSDECNHYGLSIKKILEIITENIE